MRRGRRGRDRPWMTRWARGGGVVCGGGVNLSLTQPHIFLHAFPHALSHAYHTLPYTLSHALSHTRPQVVTAWNGMGIGAFALASRALASEQNVSVWVGR